MSDIRFRDSDERAWRQAGMTAETIATYNAAIVRARRTEVGDDFSGVDRERSGHTNGPGCWCAPRAYYVHTTVPEVVR